jgi:hypothetical protein
VWSVADLGEQARIPRTDAEKRLRREEAYRDLAGGVGRLIAEFSKTPDPVLRGCR